MLDDVPYSYLKESYPEKYEIMLLRDLYENTYADIAREMKKSNIRIIQDYHYIKIRQARMYIIHLSIAHGYSDSKFFHDLYVQARDCYADWQCASAYLEKRYKTILDEYRAGEPGMSKKILSELPPFRKRWSQKTVQDIIEWREKERKTFIEIGRLLKMTKFKAEDLYDMYYHKKFMSIINTMKKEFGEKKAEEIMDDYYDKSYKPKKRYDLLCEAYPEFKDVT